MKKLVIILFVSFSLNVFTQDNYYLIDTTGINFETLSEIDKLLLDSILPLANDAKHDSTLLRYLDYLGENIWDDNIWPKYNRLVIEIADKNLAQGIDSLYISYKATAICNIGYYYNSKGKSVLALENYKASLNLFKQINNLKGQSGPLNNLGYTYDNFGDIDKALNYYHQSLKIREELNDEKGTAIVLSNLAKLYEQQEDDSIAMLLYRRTLAISYKLKDKFTLSFSYANLGNIYNRQNKKDSALYYCQEAYNLREEIGDKRGMAMSLKELGGIYQKNNQLEIALEYYINSLEITEEHNLLRQTTVTKRHVGLVYFKLGDIKKAQKISESALSDAKNLGHPFQISTISFLLSDIYKELGDFEKSLEFLKLSIQMGDSVTNLKNKKAVYRTQINYEFEQKETKRVIEEEKQKIIAEKEEEQKKIILYAVSAGMAISILFLVFLYNRFRLIKKQKLLIESQKNIVDNQRNELLSKNEQLNLKNNMITDSISYAKKIQNAISPTLEPFKKYFKDAFVLYQPKDIVSGDFYWGYQNENTILFTVADCTGHGVPGAFMSLIGNNILDKIVGESNITQPDLILERLSEELYNRLRSDNDSNIKDGMDLVICSINLDTLQLQMAGAYNPMYLVRNNELTQFKTDRYQLGNPEQINNRKFTLQEFQLEKEDVLYLFSDGFADQKGGPNGKKFYYPPFRDLLTKISKLPMNIQEKELTRTLSEWKGAGDQIDDILVLGLKI
ncbi:MAG: hypothetical protein COB15_14595 [Flavobacteriales bacterium]|nr:MAG: hypothetical protein COB15_14595 [Flavobacteriales bacterium]